MEDYDEVFEDEEVLVELMEETKIHIQGLKRPLSNTCKCVFSNN